MSRTRGLIVAVATTALILGGCSSTATPDPDPSAPTSPPASPPASPSASPPATPPTDPIATAVVVTETEFAIELSQETFTPGTYTFEVANHGGTTHDLVITGPGVDASTAILSQGETTTLTVTLSSGTYELWCSVGTHRLQGMTTTIAVA